MEHVMKTFPDDKQQAADMPLEIVWPTSGLLSKRLEYNRLQHPFYPGGLAVSGFFKETASSIYPLYYQNR
jgi:hypothetical protein